MNNFLVYENATPDDPKMFSSLECNSEPPLVASTEPPDKGSGLPSMQLTITPASCMSAVKELVDVLTTNQRSMVTWIVM